jgi:hypothetical protein
VPEPTPHPHPVRLAWADAPRAILDHPSVASPPTVVCIAGPVGSGKTTLARCLAAAAPALLVSTDDYLPDYDATPEHLRDEPDAAHLPELAMHLSDLLRGRTVDLPVWSFHEHRRTSVRRAEPAPLIVVEGIHALHAGLDPVRTLGVLVMAGTETRWARWEALESSGQRGWGVEKARIFFETVADPTFERHHRGYLRRADYLVLNDA